MHSTQRAEAPLARAAPPPRALSPKSSAERSRERRAQLQRERLVSAWLRSLSVR
jgi:hypothetical protein